MTAVLNPIYTAHNCRPAYQLNWAVSFFPHQPLPSLQSAIESCRTAWESDGIRVLEFRDTRPHAVRFWLSTEPAVSPSLLLQRLKGRLQYAIRFTAPSAFRRNYRLESIGSAKRDTIERYVRKQTSRHPMADPRAQQRISDFQIHHEDVDLGCIRYTAHGQFIYNLQVVLEHEGGRHAVLDKFLRTQRETVLAICRKKSFQISEAGIVADHLHLTLGCPIKVAPQEVALCFLNNLAYAQEMRPIYRFGYYVGTFGNIDLGALRGSRGR